MQNTVSVSRESFLQAMKPLRRFVKRKDPGEAIISMEAEELSISALGVSTGMPAFGRWLGEVKIPTRFVLMLSMAPPAGDPLILEVKDGRFRIAGLSVGCTLNDAWKSEIPLPLDPTPAQVLDLLFRYGPERIEKAGLSKRVAKAEASAMRKVAAAADILAPLGVTVEDLKALVVRKLKERAGS